MSQSLCCYCRTTLHPCDGHRECPSCLGMTHLLEDIEEPCPAAVKFSLHESSHRWVMHTPLNEEESVLLAVLTEATCERRSTVSDSHSDTQQQILATLQDLAGKMDHFRPREMGRSMQSVVFSDNDFPSYREKKGNLMLFLFMLMTPCLAVMIRT